jgi:Putative adhesin
MMDAPAARYNVYVSNRRPARWGQMFAFAVLCWAAVPAAAALADQSVSVGPNPVLNVQLDTGTLNVQTWDRPDVSVQTQGTVNVRHVPASAVDPNLSHQYTAWSQNVSTPHGNVTLPEESFVMPQLQGSTHDAVVAQGHGDTTIMVPRGTALVTAHVGTGQYNLRNYNGAFIAHVDNGGITMNHVNGSGYAEAVDGQVRANNSTFDRLRVRTATGNMLFRGCTSHQIEASSQYGSIVYDNGSFQPGLARFESVHGNVALGVRGGAQIGAHSGSGHIVSSFPNGTQVHTGSNMTQATVRGGGPVVTADSKNGSVYIYNGSARNHPRVQAELRDTQTMPGLPRPVQQASARAYAPARAFAPSNNAPRYAQPAPRYPTPQYPQRYPEQVQQRYPQQPPPVRYQQQQPQPQQRYTQPRNQQRPAAAYQQQQGGRKGAAAAQNLQGDAHPHQHDNHQPPRFR